jgi:hypothetical protein
VSPTPGPWHVDGYFIRRPDGKAVAEALWFNKEMWPEVDIDPVANAILIAAAPDLLALAKQYASECATCDGTEMVMGRGPDGEPDGDRCPDCADIRAVIAKAEGRNT